MKDEPSVWQQLLDMGIDKLHIRKPSLSTSELIQLVERIPGYYRQRLVIHHNTDAALETGAGGVNLRYNKLVSARLLLPSSMTISASVHSWEEAHQALKLCSYCLVSPVFHSLSKADYNANPGLSSVPNSLQGQQVYALGGVTAENAMNALSMGYSGVATIGFIWNDSAGAAEQARKLLDKVKGKRYVYEHR